MDKIKSLVSKLEARVSTSPVVHIVVAAFIGAAIAVAGPAILTGTITVSIAKVALYAGLSAALRSLVLFVGPKAPGAEKPVQAV